MTLVLTLFVINGVLGAADTLYYHEWKSRLAERVDDTRTELRLHVVRDAIYVVVYLVLAWWQVTGWLVFAFGLLLLAEVVITLWDFVVEDRDRPKIGSMAPGERVLHSLMAIVYGGALITLIPLLVEAISQPTGVVRHGIPILLSLAGTAVSVGCALTGIRDAFALCGVDLLRITERQDSMANAGSAPLIRR